MSEVDEIIKNAINTEVKARYGEDVFVSQTIILVLTERPRDPDDKPDTPRFQLMLKTPQPIQPSTAARMLAEAATLFQRQKISVDKQEERNKI
jgi:hypothetical protein